MSDFQTDVNLSLPHAVAGEVASNIPTTGLTLTVSSDTAINHFGRVYTYDFGSDKFCKVGGFGALAGISCLSKSMTGNAVSDGESFLAKTLGSIYLLTTGAIHMFSETTCLVGYYVSYNTTTGLISGHPTEALPAGNLLIKGARIIYRNSAANGRVIVRLTGI